MVFSKGSVIGNRPGKRVHIKPKNDHEEWDFLKHCKGPQGPEFSSKSSIQETKFFRGFHRTPKSAIKNDNEEIQKRYHAVKATRSNKLKSQQLLVNEIRSRSQGYNIISCQEYTDLNEKQQRLQSLASSKGANQGIDSHRAAVPLVKPAVRSQGRKRFDHEISEAEQQQGASRMRSTSNRFFAPPPSTEHAKNMAQQRAARIAADGLHVKRFSSVLGYQRADLPSAGVPDNFANSHWMDIAIREKMNNKKINNES